VLPAHLPVATGGIVPPALQGHTADIALPFDPAAAVAALAESQRGDSGADRDPLRRVELTYNGRTGSC